MASAPAEKTPPPAAPSQDAALAAIEVLGRLSAVFSERRRQLAASVGLTDQQWQALEEIQSEHFMPSLFARERNSSAAAVSKILRQLTDKGLITAYVSGDDARKRDYVPTGPGERALATLRAERQRAIERVWLSFGAEQLASWTALGGELAERLELYAQQNEKPEPCIEQDSREQSREQS